MRDAALGREVREQRAVAPGLQVLADQRLQRGPPRRRHPARGAHGDGHPPRRARPCARAASSSCRRRRPTTRRSRSGSARTGIGRIDEDLATLRELEILRRRRRARLVPAADLPARRGRPLPRAGGGAVLLRDHPAQGRPGVRRGQLPRALRVDRARAAARAGAGSEGSVLDRMVPGAVPRKHHLAFRDAEGRLLYEEAFTRDGFDGPYTLLYHLHRPHATSTPRRGRHRLAAAASPPRTRRSLKRHYRTQDLRPPHGPAVDGAHAAPLQRGRGRRPRDADRRGPGLPLERRRRRPLLRAGGRRAPALAARRPPLREGRLRLRAEGAPAPLPARPRPAALALARVRSAASTCRSSGATRSGSSAWTRRTRTATSAASSATGPLDEGIRELVVKRAGAFHGFRYRRLAARRGGLGRRGLPVRLPDPRASSRAPGSCTCRPTWHGTFAARGALVCSFVPRVVDFHPEAIPCPYPHASRGRGRDPLLRARRVHLAPRRRRRLDLAPPGGRDARPAPRRLRGVYRRPRRRTSSR